MANRKFTTQQKLDILKEAATHGVKETLAKHDVYPASYYNWKRKLAQQGEEHFGKRVRSQQTKPTPTVRQRESTVQGTRRRKGTLHSRPQASARKKALSPDDKHHAIKGFNQAGLTLKLALEAFGMTPHQYYYQPPVATAGGAGRPGAPPCYSHHLF